MKLSTPVTVDPRATVASAAAWPIKSVSVPVPAVIVVPVRSEPVP